MALYFYEYNLYFFINIKLVFYLDCTLFLCKMKIASRLDFLFLILKIRFLYIDFCFETVLFSISILLVYLYNNYIFASKDNISTSLKDNISATLKDNIYTSLNNKTPT